MYAYILFSHTNKHRNIITFLAAASAHIPLTICNVIDYYTPYIHSQLLQIVRCMFEAPYAHYQQYTFTYSTLQWLNFADYATNLFDKIYFYFYQNTDYVNVHINEGTIYYYCFATCGKYAYMRTMLKVRTTYGCFICLLACFTTKRTHLMWTTYMKRWYTT